MKITQSIQVKSPATRMDAGKTGQRENTNNPRQSATITAYGKPAQKYEPENQHNSGGILARQMYNNDS